MKILPFVSVLALGFASLAYAADAPTPPTKTEPPAAKATEPVEVSPELMKEENKVEALQAQMNVLLAQHDALDLRIKALQAKIDEGKAMKEKLSK
jgi:hypothetical protein